MGSGLKPNSYTLTGTRHLSDNQGNLNMVSIIKITYFEQTVCNLFWNGSGTKNMHTQSTYLYLAPLFERNFYSSSPGFIKLY